MTWTEWGAGAITAADIRKLPDGTKVYLHYRDRHGEHWRRLLTVVVMTGKFLYDGTRDVGERYRPIRCTKNQYFTLADE